MLDAGVNRYDDTKGTMYMNDAIARERGRECVCVRERQRQREKEKEKTERCTGWNAEGRAGGMAADRGSALASCHMKGNRILPP